MQTFTGDMTNNQLQRNKMNNNPMGNGCSGGAWITSKNGFYYAVGLNSYHDRRNPNVEWSPWFDSKTQQLLDKVINDN